MLSKPIERAISEIEDLNSFEFEDVPPVYHVPKQTSLGPPSHRVIKFHNQVKPVS
jgi:hypothetical protein